MKSKPKIRLTETNVPNGGIGIYKKEFRTMPIEDIENLLQDDFESYRSSGYNSFTFHRETANVSIQKK